MIRYTVILNKKGTIVAFRPIDADPAKYPIEDLTGLHFSYLIGEDCRKALRSIFQQVSRSRETGSFQTLFASNGKHEGPVIDWTIQMKSIGLFQPRYFLVGRDVE